MSKDLVIIVNRRGPSTPLTLTEIRGMINRVRRAQVAASVNDDPRWEVLADIGSALQKLHVMETGVQF